jgi:hypothetical protein
MAACPALGKWEGLEGPFAEESSTRGQSGGPARHYWADGTGMVFARFTAPTAAASPR